MFQLYKKLLGWFTCSTPEQTKPDQTRPFHFTRLGTDSTALAYWQSFLKGNQKLLCKNNSICETKGIRTSKNKNKNKRGNEMSWERNKKKKTQDLRNSIFYISSVVVVALDVWQGRKKAAVTATSSGNGKWKRSVATAFVFFFFFLVFVSSLYCNPTYTTGYKYPCRYFMKCRAEQSRKVIEIDRERGRQHCKPLDIVSGRLFLLAMFKLTTASITSFYIRPNEITRSFLLLLIEMATDLPGQSDWISSKLLLFKWRIFHIFFSLYQYL